MLVEIVWRPRLFPPSRVKDTPRPSDGCHPTSPARRAPTSQPTARVSVLLMPAKSRLTPGPGPAYDSTCVSAGANVAPAGLLAVRALRLD